MNNISSYNFIIHAFFKIIVIVHINIDFDVNLNFILKYYIIDFFYYDISFRFILNQTIQRNPEIERKTHRGRRSRSSFRRCDV